LTTTAPNGPPLPRRIIAIESRMAARMNFGFMGEIQPRITRITRIICLTSAGQIEVDLVRFGSFNLN
jgi:hypothetical protein